MTNPEPENVSTVKSTSEDVDNGNSGADRPSVRSSAGAPSSDSGSSSGALSPDSDSSAERSNDSAEDVILYMSSPDVSFRYGNEDEEVIVGLTGKRLSRNEADRIIELARHNSVPIRERGLGELV